MPARGVGERPAEELDLLESVPQEPELGVSEGFSCANCLPPGLGQVG